MRQLEELIEKSALLSVTAEAGNLASLADLQDHFGRIGKHVELLNAEDSARAAGAQAALELVQSASLAAAKLAGKIIGQEIEDAGEAIDALNDTAKQLQSLLDQACDGQGGGVVQFSPLLGLPSAPAATEGQEEGSNSRSGSIELPDNVDETIFGEFLSNLPHVLANLEGAILAAEQDPSEENGAAIKAIIHTLKGEAGLMGLADIASRCHASESLLEAATDAFPCQELLEAKDWIHRTVEMLSGEPPEAIRIDNPSVQRRDEVAEDAAVSRASEDSESLVIAENDVPLVMEFISEFREHLSSAEKDLLAIEEDDGVEKAVNSVFRAFHTIKSVASFLNLKQMGSLAHAAENLLDLARRGKIELSGAGIDVVFEAIDVEQQMLAGLLEAVEKNQAVRPLRHLDALIERIKAVAEGTEPSGSSDPVVAEAESGVGRAVKDVSREPGQVDKNERDVMSTPAAQTAADRAQGRAERAAGEMGGPMRKNVGVRKLIAESTVKVTTTRLDAMINMVGELVIAQSMVSQDVRTGMGANQRQGRNIRHLDKITRELQELAMSMRMVPVQGVFQKMARLVRDLSRKAGKQIDFVMEGAETELDRNMVEAIADPLVHMVRNSVDHGIECPDERKKIGKPAAGRITLRAFHQAGNIVIEICDDGRGLDREGIIQKALKRGVVKDGQDLSEQEAYRLVFQPGLSTAKEVTEVSGRGVGMDVVRKNIESLRGRIDIESAPRQGTTFSISLPLTLAVIDGQVVRVGQDKYIIPTSAIDQSLRPKRGEVSTMKGGQGEIVMHQGRLLPLVRLHELFAVEARQSDPCDGLLVVVGDGQSKCCLMVDAVLGQHQVVIKSLGSFLGSIPGISGGAVMGDGNVSLILDVPGLISLAKGE